MKKKITKLIFMLTMSRCVNCSYQKTGSDMNIKQIEIIYLLPFTTIVRV